MNPVTEKAKTVTCNKLKVSKHWFPIDPVFKGYLIDGLRLRLGSNEKAGAGVKDGLAALGAGDLGVDADSNSVQREEGSGCFITVFGTLCNKYGHTL